MTDDPNEQMRTFVFAARASLVAAIGLACITWATSYLAAVSASVPKCAAEDWLVGYRNGIPEFLGLPFFGAVIVVVVCLMALGRSQRLQDLFEVYDIVVLPSMQITLGMLTAYSSLFGMLGSLALATSVSFTRYKAIATYCLATAAIN
ncbi:hypothetical protein [Bradyrhizobium quebecense]|uniref:Uncharacterized protein n=2 Tax=Bradyrhizobium quebecense TaxID=2748629 RepID=A0ABS3MEN7_9BRAD|nr:hypothetical protein [Bradyrhizobium quebecense]UGY05245.1 hypothetical protein J4P68_0011115 [Bradyrhizobium quebecense]